MMKKLLCLLLSIAITVSVGGVIPIATAAESIENDIRNEFEDKYNITYRYASNGQWNGECSHRKIQSMDELKEVWASCEIYDDAFFENNFLLLINYGISADYYELHVTSVDEKSDSVNVVLDTIYVGGVSVGITSGCDVFLEMSREAIDKNVFVENRDDILWYQNIQYYAGGFNGQQEGSEDAPYIIKIDSAEKLNSYSGEEREGLINKYSESYFQNGNYLVAVNWIEPSSVCAHKITGVYDNGTAISFELSAVKPKEEGYTVLTPWCAIIPISQNQSNRDVLLGLEVTKSMEHYMVDISYYEGYINNSAALSHVTPPFVVKVNSLQSLTAWSGSVSDIEKYDEAFFENKFLIFVSWIEPSSLRTHQISSILGEGNQINIELSEFIPDGEGATVMTPYSAVIEVPLWLYDREFSATTVDLEPEPTAPPSPYPTTDPLMLEYLTFDKKTGTITDCDRSISGELVIPAKIDGVTVKEIGSSAFASCKNLTSVTIPGSVKKIGNTAFYINGNLQTVTIWHGTTNIGDNAFAGCRKLTSISIPESVVSIGSNAFFACANLTDVTLPSNLTELGDYAFKICSSLTNVTIPGTLSNIPADAFYGATNLTSVTIENGVKSIGVNAFFGCTGLTEIELSESVESISSTAFSDCLTMKKVVIPKSVTSIGANAFSETSAEFAIYGYGDSYAKTYADENGIAFIDMAAPTPTPTAIPTPIPTSSPQVITVEPPTVSVESGMVAYGTNVTLNPTSAHLAYSINGGEFVYKYFADTIIITEDTTITVKSWIDALEPNTEYIIKEATYTYTVDEATIPMDGKYTVTFDDDCLVRVYADENQTECLEAPYKTKDGNLYFFIAEADGSGKLTLTSSCGTIECLGEMSTDDGLYGYKYLLSGVTEDTVVSADYYTGPELEIFTATLNADGTVTTKVFAGYANVSAPDGTVIVGAYDENGALLAVKMYDCTGMTETLTWTDIPTVTTFKAMWWDSVNTMTPLTESYVMYVDMECQPLQIKIMAAAGEGGTVTGEGFYEYGDTVTLTATPDDGYHFVGWYENGIRLNDSTSTYNFIAEESRNLEARFMLSGSYTPVYIMATAGKGGTVTGENMYFYGDIVELTATPNEGYYFDGWYEDNIKIEGAGATYSFGAEDFRMIEARFSEIPNVPFFIMGEAETGGTTTGSGVYLYGETVTLVATPSAGFVFDGWYEDDVKITGADQTYSFIAESDRMIEARFVINTI